MLLETGMQEFLLQLFSVNVFLQVNLNWCLLTIHISNIYIYITKKKWLQVEVKLYLFM